MAKRILLIAGAACLFAGVALAETPAAPDNVDPGYLNGGHFSGWTEQARREAEAHAVQREAAAFAADPAKTVVSSETQAATPASSDYAETGYVNGGHWGN